MCGPNGTTPRFPVKTLKVAAGSTIVFGASGENGFPESNSKAPVSFVRFLFFVPAVELVFTLLNPIQFDPNFHLYHDGPATAYLSKAPGELAEYTGDGDWFKIAAVGASDGLNWDYSAAAAKNKVLYSRLRSGFR